MFEPARVAYSGSANWRSRLEAAHTFRVESRFFDFSSSTLVSAPTPPTFRIHSLFRVFSTSWSGEQEWSPAIAGQAARSMHDGFSRPSPSTVIEQKRDSRPIRAAAQSSAKGTL